MTKLAILEYPDPRLRTKAAPVTTFDAALKRQVADMFETMYAAPGHRPGRHPGRLASPPHRHRYLRGQEATACLHQPGDPRAARARRRARRAACRCPASTTMCRAPSASASASRTWTAGTRERELDGMLAVCLQHEMDHLDGKLFVDYLSELKRQRIRKQAGQGAARTRLRHAPKRANASSRRDSRRRIP